MRISPVRRSCTTTVTRPSASYFSCDKDMTPGSMPQASVWSERCSRGVARAASSAASAADQRVDALVQLADVGLVHEGRGPRVQRLLLAIVARGVDDDPYVLRAVDGPQASDRAEPVDPSAADVEHDHVGSIAAD